MGDIPNFFTGYSVADERVYVTVAVMFCGPMLVGYFDEVCFRHCNSSFHYCMRPCSRFHPTEGQPKGEGVVRLAMDMDCMEYDQHSSSLAGDLLDILSEGLACSLGGRHKGLDTLVGAGIRFCIPFHLFPFSSPFFHLIVNPRNYQKMLGKLWQVLDKKWANNGLR